MNSFEKWLDDNLMVEDYISPILNKPMHTLWTLDKVKEQYLASKESERLKYCGKCLSMANQLSLDEVKKLLKDNELCICGHKYKEHEEDDEACEYDCMHSDCKCEFFETKEIHFAKIQEKSKANLGIIKALKSGKLLTPKEAVENKKVIVQILRNLADKWKAYFPTELKPDDLRYIADSIEFEKKMEMKL